MLQFVIWNFVIIRLYKPNDATKKLITLLGNQYVGNYEILSEFKKKFVKIQLQLIFIYFCCFYRY